MQTKQLPGAGEGGKAGRAGSRARGGSRQTGPPELGMQKSKAVSELTDKLGPGVGSAKTTLRFLRDKKHTRNISVAMCDEQMP